MVCGEEYLSNDANGFKAQLPSMLLRSHSGGAWGTHEHFVIQSITQMLNCIAPLGEACG